MPNITNDQQLRQALDKLPLDRQRALGVRFANSIEAGMAEDSELARALAIAMKPGIEPREREFAYKAARSIATSTYTACGRDTDWKAQAEHFIAASCAAALAPESHASAGTGPAWKAAIQARMAQNCLMMEDESSAADNEALRQYRITDNFLDG